MESTVNDILEEHTEYSSISEIPAFETVEIESGSSAIMNLYVGRESETEVTVAHYRDGNARKPDPLVKFNYDNEELSPFYMEDTMSRSSNASEIQEFLDTWSKNLRNQFL